MQFRIIFLFSILSYPVFSQFKIKNAEYAFKVNKDRSLFVKGSVLFDAETYYFYNNLGENNGQLTFNIPIPANFRPYGLLKHEKSNFSNPPSFFQKIRVRINGQNAGDRLLIDNNICKLYFSKGIKPLSDTCLRYKIEYETLIENYFYRNQDLKYPILDFPPFNLVNDLKIGDSLNIAIKVFNETKIYPPLQLGSLIFAHYAIQKDTLNAICKIDNKNIEYDKIMLTSELPLNYFNKIPFYRNFIANYALYFVPLAFLFFVFFIRKSAKVDIKSDINYSQHFHYFSLIYAKDGRLGLGNLLGLFYKWGDEGYIKVTKLNEKDFRAYETVHNWEIELLKPELFSNLQRFEQEFAYFLFNKSNKINLFELPLYELDHNKSIANFHKTKLIQKNKNVKFKLLFFLKVLIFIFCSWFLLKNDALLAFFLLFIIYIFFPLGKRKDIYIEPFSSNLKNFNTHVKQILGTFKLSKGLPNWFLYYFSYDYFIIRRISKEINYQPIWCKDYETAARFIFDFEINNRHLYTLKYPHND